MLSYHLLRHDLTKEQRYLQRWAKRGYQLTSVHGSWHHFEKMAHQPAATLQVVGIDADPEASTVYTRRLGRRILYRVGIKSGNDEQAVAAYHAFMLDQGTRQEWRGGMAIGLGVLLYGISRIASFGSLLWLGLGALIVGYGVWTMFVGLHNTVASTHTEAVQ